MKDFSKALLVASILCFGIAIFQAAIGFSPSLSRYFGAPEVLVSNVPVLILTSFVVAGLVGLFGLYALSGAGYIWPLPWIKPMLLIISGIFLLRGLLVIPEGLVFLGVIPSPATVPPRFVLFSIGSLVVGYLFLAGTIRGWHSLPAKRYQKIL